MNINYTMYNPTDIRILVNKNHKLSKDFIPSDLVIPNVPFTFEEFHSKKQLRKKAALALEQLFHNSYKENIYLYAVSGYRSYNRQKEIFEGNVKKSGINANKYSAKPGESEHQTGLAMDVSCKSVNFELDEIFAKTKEGIWLKQNAPLFGFIIRYPKHKEHITGYQYEPWHIRYLGTEISYIIAKNNITYEEYLGVV